MGICLPSEVRRERDAVLLERLPGNWTETVPIHYNKQCGCANATDAVLCTLGAVRDVFDRCWPVPALNRVIETYPAVRVRAPHLVDQSIHQNTLRVNILPYNPHLVLIL